MGSERRDVAEWREARFWNAIERAYRHGYAAGHSDAEAWGIFRPDRKAAAYMDSPPLASRDTLNLILHSPDRPQDAGREAELRGVLVACPKCELSRGVYYRSVVPSSQYGCRDCGITFGPPLRAPASTVPEATP